MNDIFNSLFQNEEFGKYQGSKNDNKLVLARGKVLALLQRSKDLYQNPGFTYLKGGKPMKPIACFTCESENKYSVRVIYARSTLEMPNGFNCIYCTQGRVSEVHDLLIKAVAAGALDKQISETQSRLISKKPISKE